MITGFSFWVNYPFQFSVFKDTTNKHWLLQSIKLNYKVLWGTLGCHDTTAVTAQTTSEQITCAKTDGGALYVISRCAWQLYFDTLKHNYANGQLHPHYNQQNT